MRFELAVKVFEHTCVRRADFQLPPQENGRRFPEQPHAHIEKLQELRYGENPHQKPRYREVLGTSGTLAAATQLFGKQLSFNNINDTNGALDLLKEFDTPCVVAVKHANPCGVGLGETMAEAFKNAYDADPVSIYGGIIAANREIDEAAAELISKIFVEVIVAPSYTAGALEILERKQNIRILELPDITKKYANDMLDPKKVAGGLLLSDYDSELLDENNIKVVTKRAPTNEEMQALIFAWKVVKHTKSNAIVLAKGNRTTGIGPGQTNRVSSAGIAIAAAKESAKGSVMASDAFFPFDDCVQAAADAGITAIIQPGGSIRDADSIKNATSTISQWYSPAWALQTLNSYLRAQTLHTDVKSPKQTAGKEYI